MKKQIDPTIKAHLIRGAFYLLLVLAVCAIPFALAQSRSRGTAKRSVATPVAKPNIVQVPPPPAAPQVVLYDQVQQRWTQPHPIHDVYGPSDLQY